MASFMLIMILFPEVQKKAQAELDLVVRDSRLPVFDDRDSLPYLQAVYRETFRWYPTLPLGALLSLYQSADSVTLIHLK